MKRNPLTYLNIVLLGMAFLIMVWVKQGFKNYLSGEYLIGFGVLAVIWFTVTLALKKYNPKNPPSNSPSLHIIIINLLIFGIITIAMYGAREVGYSRLIVFGTIGITTLFELVFNGIQQLVAQNGNGNGKGVAGKNGNNATLTADEVKRKAVHDLKVREISLSSAQLKKEIIDECICSLIDKGIIYEPSIGLFKAV